MSKTIRKERKEENRHSKAKNAYKRKAKYATRNIRQD